MLLLFSKAPATNPPASNVNLGQVRANVNGTFTIKPLKVWDGNAWTKKPAKWWNGSSWITTFNNGTFAPTPVAKISTLSIIGNGTYSSGWRNETFPDYTTLLTNDGGSSAVYSPTVGDTLSYPLADLPSDAATVSSVEIHNVMYKFDPDIANTRALVVVSGTVYESPDLSPVSNSGYEDLSYSWTKNPATNLAWTVAEFNAIEAGVRKTNTAGERCTQIYAIVNYVTSGATTGGDTGGGTTGGGTGTSTPVTLLPVANGSRSIGWANEGTPDYTKVNTNDGGNSAIYSPTPGDIVTYPITDLASTATAVTSVTVHTSMFKLDPVSCITHAVVVINNIVYESPDLSPSSNTAYEDLSYTWAKSPATNANWTVNEVNALEVGIKKIDSAGERCSYISAVVVATS